MTGWIGIALGDMTGIGPEVALKALAAVMPADDTRYLLLGDEAHVRRLNEEMRVGLPLQPYGGPGDSRRGFIHPAPAGPLPSTLSPGSPTAPRAALAWPTPPGPRRLRHARHAPLPAPPQQRAL